MRECLVSPWGAEPCPRVPRPSQRLLIGVEAVLSLRANATNAGEGAFEAELRVQLPPGTHYQAARSTIPVGVQWGLTGVTGVGGLIFCSWWLSLSLRVPSADGRWEMPRAGGSNSVAVTFRDTSGDGCQGMPSTGSDPKWKPHTMPLISVILHGAAWWGWVPRDPGMGGSCPALGGCHSPQGPHC